MIRGLWYFLRHPEELGHELSGRLWSWPLRWRCVKCGKHLRVYGPLLLRGSGEIHIGEYLGMTPRYDSRVEFAVRPGGCLTIGNHVEINHGTRILCRKEVSIGDRCMVGPDCVIMDSDGHAVGNRELNTAPVRLEDGVWLATRVIVMPGVTIGAGSIISAGSVVTHSIRRQSIAAGVPARVTGTVE